MVVFIVTGPTDRGPRTSGLEVIRIMEPSTYCETGYQLKRYFSSSSHFSKYFLNNRLRELCFKLDPME